VSSASQCLELLENDHSKMLIDCSRIIFFINNVFKTMIDIFLIFIERLKDQKNRIHLKWKFYDLVL